MTETDWQPDPRARLEQGYFDDEAARDKLPPDEEHIDNDAIDFAYEILFPVSTGCIPIIDVAAQEILLSEVEVCK